MALNKARALQSAGRLIDKGKLKKAIALYGRIVAADPEDVRIRLKMGDLQSKDGDLVSALRTFNDVARRYEDEGQYLKAVAVYKQMLRLDNGLHSAHVALARVYNQLGLINDAISQYQSAISVLAVRKRHLQKLYVIRELLELDPDNVRARVRLAEDFLAEGKKEDGVRELRLAAETLDREQCTEEFIRVAERLLHHQPDDAVISRRLAALLLDRTSPQEALPRLQACFRAHPKDAEVLDMLSRAFTQLGQSHKALTVLKELVRVHDRNGLVNERDDALWRILELDPSDRSARVALGQLDEEPDGSKELSFETEENSAPIAVSTPSRASFDDLEALAEIVAPEPVSRPDIPASLDSAPGMAPGAADALMSELEDKIEEIRAQPKAELGFDGDASEDQDLQAGLEPEAPAEYEVGFGSGDFLDIESMVEISDGAAEALEAAGATAAVAVEADAEEPAPSEAPASDEPAVEVPSEDDVEMSEAAAALAAELTVDGIADPMTHEVGLDELQLAEELSEPGTTREVMQMFDRSGSEEEEDGPPTIQVSTLDEVEQLLGLDPEPADEGVAPTIVVNTFEEGSDLLPVADEVGATPDVLPEGVMDDLEEVDFYIKNGMRDAALGLLDELGPELQAHPEVQARRKELSR